MAELETALHDAVTWSRQTFPGRRVLPTALHLRREADELVAAVGLLDRDGTALELADVVILAAALADCLGLDLASAVRVKLDLLRARAWGPADAEGVIEHVRE